MHNKTQKHKCRLKYVDDKKLDKLYIGMNEICINCKHDCKNECKSDQCNNKVEREGINDIIDMLKEQNVNLLKFCDNYNLKLNILLEMLQGNLVLNYKYYQCIMDRCVEKNEYLPYLESEVD